MKIRDLSCFCDGCEGGRCCINKDYTGNWMYKYAKVEVNQGDDRGEIHVLEEHEEEEHNDDEEEDQEQKDEGLDEVNEDDEKEPQPQDETNCAFLDPGTKHIRVLVPNLANNMPQLMDGCLTPSLTTKKVS